MFGDIAHGAMLLALGLFAIMNNKQLESGPLKMLSQFRYMLTMMGFFAFYCGFIYNDFAGFNMNFFNSCFDPPPHPASGDEANT
jgi:V-type H+-transporting ATPase subunit a